MATSPPSQHPTRINAPLNFRHTDTLTTTKVPHYPTKLTTGMSIIPGWNRPNANGQNANINDKDYNGPDFKPRPLKHWRRQLRVYDYKGGANNSRAAAISQLDRPGLTVYHLNLIVLVFQEKAEIHILFQTINSVMKPRTTIIQKKEAMSKYKIMDLL